jgi:hypothetical protein
LLEKPTLFHNYHSFHFPQVKHLYNNNSIIFLYRVCHVSIVPSHVYVCVRLVEGWSTMVEDGNSLILLYTLVTDKCACKLFLQSRWAPR